MATMDRFIFVVSLVLMLYVSSCLGYSTSHNSGRMLKQDINATQESPSPSISATQITNDSAMPPVESPSSSSNPTMALEADEGTTVVEGEGDSTTASHNVNSESCNIPRRTRAMRREGRLQVVPNVDNQQACCEVCRATPNSACRSWFYRNGRSQNSRCFLNSFA